MEDLMDNKDNALAVDQSLRDTYSFWSKMSFHVVFSENKTFTVNHFAYFDWPDHTAPLNPKPTIGTFKLARTLAAGSPITVHCSAGIGRSATFIGTTSKIHSYLKIRENSEASMIDVVKDLRSQRYQAIQSAIQYVFLHICLVEYFAEVSQIGVFFYVKKKKHQFFSSQRDIHSVRNFSTR
uniref:Protein-tyrosine phosphatase n=1 Tax=Angiostrongylus cantonensis TaxID=6313 RepID=A0A0K0CX63_ANGCA